MFTDLLPVALRPYAKAVAAALLPLLVALVHGLLTGEFDKAELDIALTSLLSVVVLGVRNDDV